MVYGHSRQRSSRSLRSYEARWSGVNETALSRTEAGAVRSSHGVDDERVVRTVSARWRSPRQGTEGSGRHTAVDEQRLTGDVFAGVRGQEHDRPFEIARPAGTPDWNAIDQRGHPVRVVVHHLVLIGPEPPRRETVHGEAVRPPVRRQAHRQLPDAAPARAVRAEAGIAGDRRQRTDVDDAPAAVWNHQARHRLGDEERAAQVGIQNQVPVLPRDVGRRLARIAAGVVHQDVDARVRLRRLRCHRADALLALHVELERHDTAAERFDLTLKRPQRRGRPAGDDEVRARGRQRARERLSEAAARTSDHGHTAGEIEAAHGSMITFIRLRSPLYNRAKSSGPASRGALRLIIGSTSMAPRASRSMHSGISPFDPHEPSTEISRVTTDCSGRSTAGARFPIRTTVPPFRTLRIAFATVSPRPATSKATSAPRPPVRPATAAGTSTAVAFSACAAPIRRARSSFRASTSTATIVRTPFTFS